MVVSSTKLKALHMKNFIKIFSCISSESPEFVYLGQVLFSLHKYISVGQDHRKDCFKRDLV